MSCSDYTLNIDIVMKNIHHLVLLGNFTCRAVSVRVINYTVHIIILNDY